MQSDQSQDAQNLDPRNRELRRAQSLAAEGHFEESYDIAYRWLKSDPNDPQALNLIAYVMLNTEKVGIAYPILRYLTQCVETTDPLAWLNMGMAASDLWRYNEAMRAYKSGLRHAKTERDKSMLCVNIASLMVDHGRFKEAEKYCRQAIAMNADSIKGKANLGFCQLANRDWSEGWKNYRYCIGQNGRFAVQYNNEPLWDGEAKGTICIYGEQGLGDEISFAQMLPDMQKWCDENDSTLIVDMQPRLQTLIQRSFPDITIHGTRGEERITWYPGDIEYSLPLAQLGEYFRCKDEQFTGKPYLKADPNRVLQWKALFRSKNKPVIGLGWRGGIWKTAAKFRQLSLEQLYPVMKSVDAHYVSLQYKRAAGEIDDFKKRHPDIDIVEYPHGTLSNDYDDTVAMIAAMDMVVSMQTTVVHVAGGLGIPCWTFVPRTSQWRYGQEGEDFPWADSVRIIRQEVDGEWADVMQRTGDELANYPGLPKAAAGNARKPKAKLRNGGRKVRRGRKSNGRHNGDRPPA